MISICYFRIGDIVMDHSSVLECSFYENLGYLPWGRIWFLDKMELVRANFNFKEYTEIEVTIRTFTESDKSEVVFKADIVSTDIKNSVIDMSMHEIELIFILRGPNGGLLSVIEPVGYQSQTSLSVIRGICKTKNIKLDIQDGLVTSDAMSWLIVNHNFLTFMNYIVDRSYIKDSALIYNIKLDGSVGVYGIREKLMEEPKCVYMASPHNYVNAVLNNGSLTMGRDDTPVIYFRHKQFSNMSGFNKEFSTVELREMTTNTSRNKVTTDSNTLTPKELSRNGGVNVIKYQPSNSPQVYSKYHIAPSYRRAVIASYSFSINVLSDSETFTGVGDVVSVVDGTFDNEGVFLKTNMSSGKYIVLRKGYHFKRDTYSGMSVFQTTIHLISSRKHPDDNI